MLTVFIGLILGTKDRRTPASLGNSYWGTADSGAFGTYRKAGVWSDFALEALIATTEIQHTAMRVSNGYD